MLKPIPHHAENRPTQNAKTRACALTLSLALTFAPLCVPTYAQAETSNDKELIYNYTFDELIHNTHKYYLFAGNVGDATIYDDRSNASSAIANNNTFFIQEGAALSEDVASTSTSYEMSGAAAHIALYGDVTTVTANANTSSISGGYITNLNGAYIGINAIIYDDYKPTTLNTLTASDNSIVMTGGTVGYGVKYDNSALTLEDVGKSLAAVHVVSYNLNDDAMFFLNNNSVYISGGEVIYTIGNDVIFGALTGAYLSTVLGNATMSNNSVTITGGDVQARRIAGATFYTYSLNEIFTNLPVNPPHYYKDVPDQWSFDHHNTSVTMFNNSVTISGADEVFHPVLITGAYASTSNTADIYNNTVHISAGTFEPREDSYEPTVITGAYLKPIQPSSIDTEIIENGAYKIQGTVSMKAYNNSVTVTGGTITGIVSGATICVDFSNTLKKYINTLLEYQGSISNNTVTVYGGEITSDTAGNNGIYGGLYQGIDQEGSDSIYGDSEWKIINTYSITNNTVNIGFDALLDDSISIAGGAFNNESNSNVTYVTLTPNVNTYDGNTLNINQLANTQTISTIANFEKIDFVLGTKNTTSQLANTALLALNDTLYLGNGYATEEDTETAYSNGDTTATTATKFTTLALNTTLDNSIADGDTITLLSANTISGAFTNLDENNEGTLQGTKGAFLTQTWDIENTNNTLSATLQSTVAGEQAKVLGEVNLGGVAMLNGKGDLLTGASIPNARQNVQSAQNKQEQQSQESQQDQQSSSQATNNGISGATFAVTGAGSSRYNIGSHVDVNSFNISAGLAYGGNTAKGDWLAGVFIEYGYGDYSTYNSLSNASTIRGDGSIESVGGGIFARFDFDLASTTKHRPYIEGSMRGGSMHNEYSTSDISDETTLTTGINYSTHNSYFGAHFTAGNVYSINEKLSLDTALTYYWTHQDSKQEVLFGHDIQYDSINSHRVRANARLAYEIMEHEKFTFGTYTGLGYEYEFDGDAVTYVDGLKAPVPTVKGGTGIGELGVSFKGNNSPFAVNVGVQGYVGLREGVSGSVQVMFKF